MGSCLKLMGDVGKCEATTLVGIRQSQHLTFKNVLLSSVVSNNVNSNQRHMAKSLGTSRYSVKNAVVKRIHVDPSKEKFLGGDASKKMK